MASPSRVVITGLTGFTGKHLAERFAREGWDVFGISDAGSADLVRLLPADLGETQRIAEWLADVRPHYVVHLAAISHVVGPALRFYDVNVLGTESLLEAIAASGTAPDKVVLASSANVYGQTQASPIDEGQPIAPANHYAASKAAMEWVARQWFDRLPIAVTRPFNYTGPGQSEAFLYAKLVGAFHRREPVLTIGNARVSRDLSDVSYVTEAYFRLLCSSFASDAVNICSGRSVSVAEALAILRDLTGHDPRIEHDPALIRKNDIETLTGDPARLQAVAGPLSPVAPEDLFRTMLAALDEGSR